MADDIEIKPIPPGPFEDDWHPSWSAWERKKLGWMMKELGVPQHMLGLPGEKEKMTEPKNKYEGYHSIQLLQHNVPEDRVVLDVLTIKEVDTFDREERGPDGYRETLRTPMEVENVYFVTAVNKDNYVSGLIKQRDELNNKYSELTTESSELRDKVSKLELSLAVTKRNCEVFAKSNTDLQDKVDGLVKEKEELIDHLGQLTEHFGKAKINEIIKSDDE